ncbi:MAG: ferrous iron transport protein A [Ruminococcaceae bacterium]|nr:ferrous iron transport protein A [Oscillospiraceae bacterium]
MKTVTMSTLMPGMKARIKSIDSKEDIRRRLLDLGMIENTIVECVGKSPLGDPSAYLVRGAVIVIRDIDSALIRCEI